MKKLLSIVGPTATGKTQLAINLARRFNGELISCDSRQVYRFMDIATGKDITTKNTQEELAFDSRYRETSFHVVPYAVDTVPLWLYDVITPDCDFSVSQFETIAKSIVESVHARGKVPILVGGTGFYYHAVVYGIESGDLPPNQPLRDELSKLSLINLQNRLQTQYPDVFRSMNNSDQNNPRRLIRRIELASKGFTYSEQSIPRFDAFTIGLTLPLPALEERIAERVEKRVIEGSINELRDLLKRGYTFSLPSMQTLGYQEWEAFIKNPSEKEKQTAIANWILHERQYAKRQMTWFKKETGIAWYDVLDKTQMNEIEKSVEKWLKS